MAPAPDNAAADLNPESPTLEKQDKNTTKHFHWPPRPVEVASPLVTDHSRDASSTSQKAGRFAATRRALAEIERVWLQPTRQPLAVRMRTTGWTPDHPALYCEQCGLTVGAYEETEFGCANCHNMRWPWDRFVRLSEYDGHLAKWVKEVKFERSRILARDLGALLGKQLRSAGALDQSNKNLLVIPMPTTWRRRAARGVDHALLIADAVARELQSPLQIALSRRHTPSQRAVPPSQRSRNAARARYTLRRPERLLGKRIILVDDVRTSGASLDAASRAIRRALDPLAAPPRAQIVEIWAATLGSAPDPARKMTLSKQQQMTSTQHLGEKFQARQSPSCPPDS